MTDIKCEREGEFLKEERRALGEEFEKHRLLMEKKLGRKVSKAEATTDYIEGNLEDFAEGFRMGFCARCEVKDECRGKKV